MRFKPGTYVGDQFDRITRDQGRKQVWGQCLNRDMSLFAAENPDLIWLPVRGRIRDQLQEL